MTHAQPIALQLYSVRDELARDWRGTLEKVAAMGYIGVETAGFDYAGSAQTLKDVLDRLGLTVTSAHSPLPLGNGREKIVENVKTLGTNRLVLGGTGREQFDTVSAIEAQAEIFNEANAFCRENGLTFGLHNHWWEYTMVDDRRAYNLLREQLDEDIIFELDTYWTAVGGEDPLAEIASMGERAVLLHVKDGPINIDGDMVAVGSGDMDYGDIIAAASAAEWLIVELDRCGTDMLTAVADSYKYLTGMGLARGKES